MTEAFRTKYVIGTELIGIDKTLNFMSIIKQLLQMQIIKQMFLGIPIAVI